MKCGLIVLCVVIGVLASVQAGCAEEFSYAVNKDGTISRMTQHEVIEDQASLRDRIASLKADVALVETLRTMSPGQLEAAHRLWEKYREQIKKKVITVPQAVENLNATNVANIKAMEAVLTK